MHAVYNMYQYNWYCFIYGFRFAFLGAILILLWITCTMVGVHDCPNLLYLPPAPGTHAYTFKMALYMYYSVRRNAVSSLVQCYTRQVAVQISCFTYSSVSFLGACILWITLVGVIVQICFVSSSSVSSVISLVLLVVRVALLSVVIKVSFVAGPSISLFRWHRSNQVFCHSPVECKSTSTLAYIGLPSYLVYMHVIGRHSYVPGNCTSIKYIHA